MLKSNSITLSSNAFEFIRQCKEERKFPDVHRILQEAQRTDAALYDHVQYIVGLGVEGRERLSRQRELVRDMMQDALRKILYTQEQFAGALIALSKEFGVAEAFIEEHTRPITEVPYKWTVTVYGPELWGKRFEFDTEEGAKLFVARTLSYGTFTL